MKFRSLSLETNEEGIHTFLTGALAGAVLGAALFLTPAYAKSAGNTAMSNGGFHASAKSLSAWTQYYNSRARWVKDTKGRWGLMHGHTSGVCGGCTAPDPARDNPNYSGGQ